jgi:phosphoribosylformylglycinamidine synthase
VQALVESSLRSDRGVTVEAQGDPFVFLWSESATRVVASSKPADIDELLALAAQLGVPATVIGHVADHAVIEINGVYDGSVRVVIADLRNASEATLPALFG